MPGIALEDPLRIAETLRDEFRAGAAERDRERQFPYEQCAAFRASGLLGLMVPREYGGYGGSFADLMKVVIAISAGDSNIGQMYQLHTGGIRLMQEFASPAVQAKWLPRFATGAVDHQRLLRGRHEERQRLQHDRDPGRRRAGG